MYYYIIIGVLLVFDEYISKQKCLNAVFGIEFKKKDENMTEEWQKAMLVRWVDLEARVTALEMVDKEYKKRARRKVEDLDEHSPTVILPV